MHSKPCRSSRTAAHWAKMVFSVSSIREPAVWKNALCCFLFWHLVCGMCTQVLLLI